MWGGGDNAHHRRSNTLSTRASAGNSSRLQKHCVRPTGPITTQYFLTYQKMKQSVAQTGVRPIPSLVSVLLLAAAYQKGNVKISFYILQNRIYRLRRHMSRQQLEKRENKLLFQKLSMIHINIWTVFLISGSFWRTLKTSCHRHFWEVFKTSFFLRYFFFFFF